MEAIDYIRVNYNDENFDDFSTVCGWNLEQVENYLTEINVWNEVKSITLNF